MPNNDPPAWARLAEQAAHKDTNAKDGAAAGDGRLDMTLVPTTFIAAVAVALTEGDLKYWAMNWRAKGVAARVYVAALLRHLFRWVCGQHADPKTGVPHLWSVGACVAILVDAQACGRFIDDRPIGAPMDEMLEDCRRHVLHLREVYKEYKRPADGPYLMRDEEGPPNPDDDTEGADNTGVGNERRARENERIFRRARRKAPVDLSPSDLG